jgi:molecular chaperone GrpE
MINNTKKQFNSKSNDPSPEELLHKLDELTQALQRERADAINVRRRADDEKLKMANYFKAQVIQELLPFIENFDLAIKHLPKSDQVRDWDKGLISVHAQLWQILDTIGVKKIKSVGTPFDPKLHEAIQMDDSTKGSKEVVIEEFRAGYVLNDEVIRHAMVKVGLK